MVVVVVGDDWSTAVLPIHAAASSGTQAIAHDRGDVVVDRSVGAQQHLTVGLGLTHGRYPVAVTGEVGDEQVTTGAVADTVDEEIGHRRR